MVSFDYTATASDGSTVTGTFGYDTSVPGVLAPDPALDAAVYLAGFWNGTITGGVFDGLDFDYSTVETGVANGVDFIGPIDDVLIVQPNENGLILVDSTATVFSDASLPLMLTLADFNVASIFLDGDDLTGDANNLDEQSYLLTSLTLSPTPIPAPLPAVLLGTAVMALPVFRRRRSAA